MHSCRSMVKPLVGVGGGECLNCERLDRFSSHIIYGEYYVRKKFLNSEFKLHKVELVSVLETSCERPTTHHFRKC